MLQRRKRQLHRRSLFFSRFLYRFHSMFLLSQRNHWYRCFLLRSLLFFPSFASYMTLQEQQVFHVCTIRISLRLVFLFSSWDSLAHEEGCWLWGREFGLLFVLLLLSMPKEFPFSIHSLQFLMFLSLLQSHDDASFSFIVRNHLVSLFLPSCFFFFLSLSLLLSLFLFLPRNSSEVRMFGSFFPFSLLLHFLASSVSWISSWFSCCFSLFLYFCVSLSSSISTSLWTSLFSTRIVE